MIIDYEPAFYSVMVASIVTALWAEALFPVVDKSLDLQHLARNFSIWLIAFVLADYVVAFYWIDIQAIIKQQPYGLFYWFPLPFDWMLIAIGVLLVELADYFYHRLSHQNAFLWRFHMVHHTDTSVDLSTSLRTHPLELVLANFVRYLTALAFGFPIWVIGFRELLVFPILFFQHANVQLPNKWEAVLSTAFVTPRVHRVHHSDKREEHDSNYCNGLIWWDKLFGTFKEPVAESPDAFGVRGFENEKYQTIDGMLLTPFYKVK